VKFLVDMPLSPGLAHWLQDLGHDAVHASELGLSQSPDEEIFHVAAREQRVIVTADLDFPRLFAMIGRDEPGLILLRGGNYSEAESITCIQRVLMQVPHEQLCHSIVVVDHRGVRRRSIPL
jgi:predicted nuclease of predicted toxin-antitoxin system